MYKLRKLQPQSIKISYRLLCIYHRRKSFLKRQEPNGNYQHEILKLTCVSRFREIPSHKAIISPIRHIAEGRLFNASTLTIRVPLSIIIKLNAWPCYDTTNHSERSKFSSHNILRWLVHGFLELFGRAEVI